jgi:hypothetical protein
MDDTERSVKKSNDPSATSSLVDPVLDHVA